ncbi:hypothetical protein [Moraxella lacunata]|uniref:hypothetical protein n=1 Tax=Moraxella lacunata TaxID=477 RepID=UPI003EDF17AA
MAGANSADDGLSADKLAGLSNALTSTADKICDLSDIGLMFGVVFGLACGLAGNSSGNK